MVLRVPQRGAFEQFRKPFICKVTIRHIPLLFYFIYCRLSEFHKVTVRIQLTVISQQQRISSPLAFVFLLGFHMVQRN